MPRVRFLFWLDVVLLLALAPLEEPRTTGLPGHEWLGIAFVLVIGLHLLVNWRWIVTTLRRVAAGDSRRARINAALNGSLFVLMAITLFSGLVISEVALPLFGYVPSDLAAWRQLHSLAAGIALVVVGLHVGLNWDWIVGAMRKLRGHAAQPDGSGSMLKRLGLGGLGVTLRRTAVLALTTAVLCGATYLLVQSVTGAKIRRRKERAWATADLAAAPEDIAVQLIIVAVAAVAGRKVLRLRL
jgi:cytochrome b561